MGKSSLSKKSEFLHDLKNLSHRDRCKFLSDCSPQHIHTVSEAVHNLLKSKQLMQKRAKKINQIKIELMNLANPKYPVERKRKILNQKGAGIFSVLAATVLPLLASLITKK